MKKTVFVLLCLAVSGMLSACGGPRYIVDTTSREKSIKFMYVGDEGQGVLQCDKAENGALSNCRDIAIEFRE